MKSEKKTKNQLLEELAAVREEIAGLKVLENERRQAEEAQRESVKAAKRLSQENAIIAEIGRIISSTLNIEEVYEGFADEVRKVIPFDRIVIDGYNPEEDSVPIAYVTGIEIAGRRAGDIIPFAGSDTEYIMHTRSPLLIQTEDEREVSDRFPALLPTFHAGFRSMLSVPLISKDQVIGGLHFRSFKPDAYTELDLRLAERVGNQISGAIANTKLFFERKLAEKALRVSEAKYRQLVEQAPVWIYEVNLNHLKFLSVNDVMCETTGYSREEFLSMSPFMLLTEEGKKELINRNQKILSGEKVPESVEYRMKTKDGTEIWKLVNAKFIYEDGRPVRSQVVAHDITERKRLEEQLLQSQKMEAVGRLAGGIAHDFNNLLTIIKGCSELTLMELKGEGPLKGKIEEIQRAADRASALTRQLLAFSRRQVMEMKVIDLNTLLRDLNKMLRRVIGEDIELVTIFSEDLGRVKVDPGQIEQMILNLAVNARDAMPSGGRLTLMTVNAELDEEYVQGHVGATPGRYVMLSVRDTGVGMRSEVREQIFEPFFTTKERGKGTGLGLSTVYGIVSQSGGHIWVYSEPGQGTSFKIYLPRVEEPLEEGRKSAFAEELPRGNETVLVVEDEEQVRKLAVAILQRQGYRVLESSQGREAFLVCEQHEGPLHLMLADVVMPVMSGPELAKRLEPLHPEMRVLYMSGYPDDAIVHQGVLEEGVNYIQKPFTVGGLMKKVREVLDK